VPDTFASPGEGLPDLGDALPVAQLCTRAALAEAQNGLIEAVARRYDVEPACVTPTLGASTAILHALLGIVRAGDHVVVERPTYEALRRAPELLGATVSRLERKLEESWAVVPERLAQLLTPRTRAVILSNLHNPSGTVIDEKTMEAIAELAARVGAMVLVDEVYLDYCFSIAEGRTVAPACKVAKNCVSWSSATKCFGFSALRAGWIVATDPDASRAIRNASDYLHVFVPTATAALGARVLEHGAALQARAAARSQAGRKVVERWLRGDSRVQWVPPHAGITGLVKLPSFLQDGALAEHVRQRYDTQIVPGSMFEAPGHVRISFGIDPDMLAQGLAHVSAGIDDLT
jgi:aspartate/methionine/tyrosine aminotransferase